MIKLGEIPMDCNLESLKDSCVNADGRTAASEEATVLGTRPTGTDLSSNLIAPWLRATKSDNFSGNIIRRQKIKNSTHDDFDGFTVEMFLDEDGDYLAHFVELPNVSAFGQTPDEALIELKAAWELMKECYREDGVSVPRTRTATLLPD